MLSVIIPTLNAAPTLDRAVASLPVGVEIVVSDGGSGDGTLDIARGLGARIISGPPGRGGQMARGAAAATGDWLLFLHADSWLGDSAAADIRDHMSDPARRFEAAVFAFHLDDESVKARLLERAVALRCRLLALPYGDQGLLISRAFHDALGGFKSLPLMEDVDLIRRIGRARLRLLASPAVTSADRYRRDGYGRRAARNLFCLSLYFLGLPPRRILAIYR